MIDRAGAVDDLMRPMTAAVGAITFMAVLLWVVAALIVGSVIYLSALERTRDFAVLKAVGVSTRAVLAGLCLQAVIVAVVAAVLLLLPAVEDFASVWAGLAGALVGAGCGLGAALGRR